MVTSLWELRKRPLPWDLVTSPTVQQLARESSIPPFPALPDVLASASSRCQYRRNKCVQPRAHKQDGSLHSLCAMHRDRSVANQWRFDEKKRKQREATLEMQAQKNAARRKQRREQNTKRHSPSDRPKTHASATVALPTFKHFKTMVGNRTAVANNRRSKPFHSSEDRDATRAWLRPFPADGDCHPPTDSAWRNAAVAQFLLDQ